MITLGPVPAEAGPLAEFLMQVRQAIQDLQQPGEPMPIWTVEESELPAASDYPNCGALVTDIPAFAISTFNGSAWVWTRADGGAL